MSTKSQWKTLTSTLLAAILILCAGSVSALAATSASQKKAKKPPLPPLLSGTTGPVQQIPLDSIAAVPPQVSYENNQLTIVAPNSTLADILRAVRKITGAEIEIPSAPERVVTHLGPGPARDVVAELLNGSRFNYVLLGSAGDDAALSRVVLVAKTGPQDITPNPQPVNNNPGVVQVNGAIPPPQPEQPPDAAEAEQADDNANADDNGDQNAAEAEQQPPQENPGIKTPQQMLQEMQQRQLQIQQNQPPGQPPIPGSGMPPHPPQEQ